MFLLHFEGCKSTQTPRQFIIEFCIYLKRFGLPNWNQNHLKINPKFKSCFIESWTRLLPQNEAKMDARSFPRPIKLYNPKHIFIDFQMRLLIDVGILVQRPDCWFSWQVQYIHGVGPFRQWSKAKFNPKIMGNPALLVSKRLCKIYKKNDACCIPKMIEQWCQRSSQMA